MIAYLYAANRVTAYAILQSHNLPISGYHSLFELAVLSLITSCVLAIKNNNTSASTASKFFTN